jgi:hypothetical protein
MWHVSHPFAAHKITMKRKRQLTDFYVASCYSAELEVVGVPKGPQRGAVFVGASQTTAVNRSFVPHCTHSDCLTHLPTRQRFIPHDIAVPVEIAFRVKGTSALS